MTVEQERKGESRLFFRRWMAHPFRMGALLPSGCALGNAMAKVAQSHYREGEYVVELGPGTGAVTRALINAGIPEERLILIERDEDMTKWLREHFFKATILSSDACRLDKTLVEHGRGKVSTVVSSLPFTTLPDKLEENIVRAIRGSLEEGGRMVQFTYKLFSPPLSCEKHDLVGKRENYVWLNIPPATVWSYSLGKSTKL